MSRQKLQLLVAMCREIPDRLNVQMLQHVCSELLKFQEGAWALWLPGAHAVNVVYKGLVQMRLRVPPALWHVLCWAFSPCSSVCILDVHQGPYLMLALSIATHSPPNAPQLRANLFIFQVSCCWPGSVSQKLQFMWAIWSSAGLIVYFSLMSKAWEWREAELFLMLVVASQTPRVAIWESSFNWPSIAYFWKKPVF